MAAQTVRVEHVHVNEGGLAIIGNVRSGTADVRGRFVSPEVDDLKQVVNQRKELPMRNLASRFPLVSIPSGLRRL
jgi:hypothetical protein